MHARTNLLFLHLLLVFLNINLRFDAVPMTLKLTSWNDSKLVLKDKYCYDGYVFQVCQQYQKYNLKKKVFKLLYR